MLKSCTKETPSKVVGIVKCCVETTAMIADFAKEECLKTADTAAGFSYGRGERI